jgi:UDP-N-acetylmuramoyl-L-alanyl-D-glutamate--2,6-diaminopimelate ligase
VATGHGALELRAVTENSRQIGPGMIFAALKGSKLDGTKFIPNAIAQGAVAVLAEPGAIVPAGTLLIESSQPRRVLAQIATRLAGPMPRVIAAITGTNGKTSSADFLRQIWEYAGTRAASIGTLGIIAAGQPPRPSLTTPDPVTLARELAALQQAGIDYVAIEASSHGLDQARLDGVPLSAGGFTNLTRDHLDYHGDMANYAAAKLRLFNELLPAEAPAVASTALDGAIMDQMREIAARRNLQMETVGKGGSLLDLRRATPAAEGQILELRAPLGLIEIMLPLAGSYQADNVLMAAGLALMLESSSVLESLLHLRGVRGRLELVARLPHRAAAYVDYAHTPDAITRLLQSLRPHCAGRLILVFGAGGDRDAGKRPLMGAVAAQLADIAIITDDNPRSENPATIRAAIKAACPTGIEIGDRRRAIAAALNMAGPDDLVVVAGKGHELGQVVGDQVLPFDDAAVIREWTGAL